MRRGSADSIRASGKKTPHQQAGYKTAICLPITPKSVLASREDDAWTAFYEAVKEPSEDIIVLRDTTPEQTVVASSDEDLYNTAAA